MKILPLFAFVLLLNTCHVPFVSGADVPRSTSSNAVVTASAGSTSNLLATVLTQLHPAVTSLPKFITLVKLLKEDASNSEIIVAEANLLKQINENADSDSSEIVDKELDLAIALAEHWDAKDETAAGCCDKVEELAKQVASLNSFATEKLDGTIDALGKIEQVETNVFAIAQDITNQMTMVSQAKAQLTPFCWFVSAGLVIVCFVVLIILGQVNRIKAKLSELSGATESPGSSAGYR